MRETSIDLDLPSVIGAVEAIASEVQLERLLVTLVRVQLELSEASRCVLLLLRDQSWQIEAIGTNGGSVSVKLLRAPLASHAGAAGIPHEMIEQAARVGELLQARFDPAGACLCLPIARDRQLLGMFYLEKAPAPDSFQPRRVAVLQALIGQVAIALENAYRYRDLQQSLSELRSTKARLEYDAHHDALTNLYNRSWLVQRLAKIVSPAVGATRARAHTPPARAAVLSIDLDRFKLVNDSLGHAIGDELLRSVGVRLRELLSGVEGLVRIGGDEFAVLLEHPEDVDRAVSIAEEIVDALRQPFTLGTYEIYTSARIGIALSTPETIAPEDVLKDADVALTRARERGGGGVQLFDPAMRREIQDDTRLEYELRLALTHPTHPFEGFYLQYQPIISMASGELIGYEALLRWKHRDLGQIPPDRFISLAEEIGLIEPLSWWALREACQQLSEWRTWPGGESLVVQVNISPVLLMQVHFTTRVAAIIQETGLPGQALKLEITESSTLDVQAVGLQSLVKLRAMGVLLCIDDFGTGYSSLSRLRELPIATIKIDRVFISRMSTRDDGLAIVEMILALGETLKMEIVAEGVETTEQWRLLRTIGCVLGQGFLFSSPLDAEAAGSLIGKRLALGEHYFVWQKHPYESV
jgi:diguanylate cyclase (GGDEF)-like protein